MEKRDAQNLIPGLQLRPWTKISRVRELPVKGEILVKVGDAVTAPTIVGRASLQGELAILRIPEKMGIEPFEVMAGLRVKIGDSVKQGDLVAEHRGLFGLFTSRFTAPYSGAVEFITERVGHVGLRLPPKPFEVNAYVSGKVISVEAGKSAVIEGDGSFIQGIFGVGGERQGVLAALSNSPEYQIEEKAIPADCKGKILFGGHSPSDRVLKIAAERGAVGFITGSIDDEALKGYLGYDIGIALTGDEEIPMSVIVTEGFGKIPMAKRVWDLLSKQTGASASINGATQVRAGAVRPEIIVFGDKTKGDKGSDIANGLSVGARVRIIRVPWFGRVGEVTELPSKMVKIETGAEARILRVKLESGENVIVPRANVELY